MTKNLRIGKVNKIALLIASVHFLISFFSDRLIFRYLLFDFSNTKNALRCVEAWIVKICFWVFLIVLWQGIFYLKKKAGKDFRRIFFCYFGLMMVLLLFTWPGIFRQDEFGLLSSAVQLFPLFWQNYLSSVFYVISLMLFPFPSGVIILQCICIALIVARIETALWDDIARKNAEKSNLSLQKAKKCFFCIFSFAFLLFPVLDSNLYPIRMSLYAFLELWLIVEVYLATEKGRQEENAFTASYALLLLAAIVTVWRAEAIYYVVFFPLLLLLLFRKRTVYKPLFFYFLAFLTLFLPQKIGDHFTDGQQYELTSIVLPLVALVEAADEKEDASLLAAVDKIMKVDVILSEAQKGKTGIQIFWEQPAFQQRKSDADFAACKTAYRKLIIKYPMVFLKERWNTFLQSSDLLDNTTLLFTEQGNSLYDAFRAYPLSGPIVDKIRTGVIKTLEIRNASSYEEKLKITDVIYSAIPMICFLFATCLVLSYKRKWKETAIVVLPLLKVPLIFLTAPSRLFMYYYSIYLIGYAMLFYFLSVCMIRKCVKSGIGRNKWDM